MKVAVLGAARISRDSSLYQQAYSLGKILAIKKCILTAGGGKGIMEAVSIPYKNDTELLNSICIDGDQDGDECYKWNGYGKSIFVKDVKEQSSILCDNQDIIIVFPGGTGTLHELFYILTCRIYMSTKIILIGQQLKDLLDYCTKCMGNELFNINYNNIVFINSVYELDI